MRKETERGLSVFQGNKYRVKDPEPVGFTILQDMVKLTCRDTRETLDEIDRGTCR